MKAILDESSKLTGEQATRKTDLQKLEEQLANLQKSLEKKKEGGAEQQISNEIGTKNLL